MSTRSTGSEKAETAGSAAASPQRRETSCRASSAAASSISSSIPIGVSAVRGLLSCTLLPPPTSIGMAPWCEVDVEGAPPPSEGKLVSGIGM